MNILCCVFREIEEQKQDELGEGVEMVMVVSQLQNGQKARRRVKRKRISHQRNRQLMLAYGTSTTYTGHLSVCSTAGD